MLVDQVRCGAQADPAAEGMGVCVVRCPGAEPGGEVEAQCRECGFVDSRVEVCAGQLHGILEKPRGEAHPCPGECADGEMPSKLRDQLGHRGTEC